MLSNIKQGTTQDMTPNEREADKVIAKVALVFCLKSLSRKVYRMRKPEQTMLSLL
jgi:hypothetical protein